MYQPILSTSLIYFVRIMGYTVMIIQTVNIKTISYHEMNYLKIKFDYCEEQTYFK